MAGLWSSGVMIDSLSWSLGHHTTVGVDMTVDEATSDQINTNRHRRLSFATTC